jgi:hypothetical protein
MREMGWLLTWDGIGCEVGIDGYNWRRGKMIKDSGVYNNNI